MTHNCRKCGVPLVIGENVTQNRISKSDYICQKCHREYRRDYTREWYQRTGRHQPMCENRGCSSFLGVHVAERVLSHLFKDVIRMPYGNPGFDFRCGKGYLVDAKCSCRRHSLHRADSWMFAVNKNPIADYFLCLAFDNRDDLNPEHIWMIPAGDVNDHVVISIAETTLEKWQEYEQPLDKVIACCDSIMTGGI